MTEPEIKIVEIYEDNVGECGLIFSNSGSANLNCNAKLLDVGYETPQGSLSLSHPTAGRSAAPNSADRQRWGRDARRQNGTIDR